MKKLIVLSPEEIDYVYQIAKKITPRGTNFSRAISYLISFYKQHGDQKQE